MSGRRAATRRLLAAIAALLVATAGWPGTALARPRLSAGPVVVGDRQSLSRLAQANLGLDGLGDGENQPAARGLAAVALRAVERLERLKPEQSPWRLAAALSLTPARPSLYSLAVELAERYRVSPLPGTGAPASSAWTGAVDLTAAPRTLGLGGERELPEGELRLAAAKPSGLSLGDLAEVAGIRLSGRLVPPEPETARPAAETPGVDLVATVPLVPSKVDVTARYRLVDVDRLGTVVASPGHAAQTVGVGGQVALGQATVLKAELEVTRRDGELSGTRAGAGLSLQLSGDASLRASYTLINFGASSAAGQVGREAAAELSLKF